MAHLKNHTNEYADALDRGVFDAIPKSVFAAIAVSLATTGGERLDEATALIVQEWKILHENKIVPQAPPRALLAKLVTE